MHYYYGLVLKTTGSGSVLDFDDNDGGGVGGGGGIGDDKCHRKAVLGTANLL
jgi:hypothetical protein